MTAKFKFSPHVAVQVQNHKQAIEFYRNILGMELITEEEGESQLRKDGMNFHVEDSHQGLVFFEFETDDMDAAKNLLMENGCTIRHIYSEKSIMFSDGFGLHFHVFEKGD